MRDERKVVLLGKHTVGKPKIQIFTSAGRLIANLNVSTPPYPTNTLSGSSPHQSCYT
jgi:hypothetical protein